MRRTYALHCAIAAIAISVAAPLLAITSNAATPTITDTTLTNSSTSGTVGVLTNGDLASRNGVSALLYYQSWGSHPWAAFRDSSTGAISDVSLAASSVNLSEWLDARAVLATDGKLWVASGSGPVFVRAFELSGSSPLPTSASLVGTWTFGDGDSSGGDLIELSSGALTLVWHQRGSTGPEGYGIAHLGLGASAWTQTYPVNFMVSRASRQVAVQHPADGSVWVFSSPDAWGRIGALHLTESASGLTVDWANANFLTPQSGISAPDQEAPWLGAAGDPATGTIALAYQSNDRQIFSTSPVVTGSKPVVTRIGATGAIVSTLVLPTYVERVSSMALTVRGSSTWLTYRPIDQATLAFKDLYVSYHDGSSWQRAAHLGTLASNYERVSYTTTAPEFVARMSDGKFHYFAEVGSSTTTSTTVSSTTSSTTSTTSTTTAPAPKTKVCKARKCR